MENFSSQASIEPWHGEEGNEYGVMISNRLPSDLGIQYFVLHIWKTYLRRWWKAWTDRLDILEPKSWWQSGDTFHVICTSQHCKPMQPIPLSDVLGNQRFQFTIEALHDRQIGHGALNNACWSNGDIVELVPPLSYDLVSTSDEDLIKADQHHFSVWNPAKRVHLPLSPIQRNLLLTLEFEELLDYKFIYRYRLDTTNGMSIGEISSLSIDPEVPHPKYGPMDRVSGKELYTKMFEETEGESVQLALTSHAEPYPREALLVQVLRVDRDDENALIVKIPKGEKIESEGWCQPYNQGTVELGHRKRDALRRAVSMRHIERIFKQRSSSDVSSIDRRDLPKAIVSQHGTFCVQGPPGTGKTFLACEVVDEIFHEDPLARVLLCAKEHAAVDLLRERVTALFEEACPSMSRYQPRSQTKSGSEENVNIGTSDVWATEILTNTSDPAYCSAWVHYCNEYAGQPPSSLSELHEKSAQIILSTTTSGKLLQQLFSRSDVPFDFIIIEEASKCYPSELIPVMALGQSSLLIGDHNQLPPFQIDEISESASFFQNCVENPYVQRSLLEKNDLLFRDIIDDENFDWSTTTKWLQPFATLMERGCPKFRLMDQYRMIPLISNLIGSIFYGHNFTNHRENVESLFTHPEIPDLRLCWIDIPHCSCLPEAREKRSGLRVNSLESETLAQFFKEVRYSGHANPDVAILSPYNAQVDWLSGNHGYPGILPQECASLPGVDLRSSVHTVDSFQGHEADLVVLSLVRNNPLGTPRFAWGFMTRPERLNVMLSRARTYLVIIGSSDHVRAHASHKDMAFFSDVLKYIEEHGTIIPYSKLEVHA